MATNDWFSKFPDTKVYHLDATTSDHKALLIQPKGMECNQQKPFRFEQMWMAKQGLQPLKRFGKGMLRPWLAIGC